MMRTDSLPVESRSGSRSPRMGPRFSPAQVVAFGLVAASIGWAAWLVRDRPISEDVELLPGTVLPSSELAIIEAAFDRAQLADHRTEDGRVWVPRSRQSAYMRALVDAEALPREFGSSLRRALENNSPWQSRAVQEEMLRVAVQEELAHVICSMPGIERAAVLYDVGQRSGIDAGLGSGPVRTASVNVRTQPDAELEPARVQAIRVLVAASIAGLEAERVAVTDLRSGRVYAGPLLPPAAEAEFAIDPELARRVAHERHLAAKVRQALAFVKGALVDVTVAFPPPGGRPQPASRPLPPAAPSPPPAPESLATTSQQRAADANAPARVGPPAPPVDEPPAVAADDPVPAVAMSAPAEGLQRIVVSVAVPEAYVRPIVQAALARNPAADPATEEQREHERLAALVRNLLPQLPDADACRVVMTTFPVASAQAFRGVAATAPAAVSPAGSASQRPRTPGAIVDATWQALARGDAAAVPREAWIALITLASAALAALVLRGAVDAGRPERPRRAAPPRIDWAALEVDTGGPRAPGHASPAEPLPRQVAA